MSAIGDTVTSQTSSRQRWATNLSATPSHYSSTLICLVNFVFSTMELLVWSLRAKIEIDQIIHVRFIFVSYISVKNLCQEMIEPLSNKAPPITGF